MIKHKHRLRCAVYTRKSTEEGLDQEFNSLDAQRESGLAYIASQQHEGWTCTMPSYDDGGYTGGNMDRPALNRLLADIEAGLIDCVVVYKVDRLSRSLLDFARMMEVFDKHHVAFVSVTQQFNTASSMGRLILNVLLSFAQFEREIISERTRDKIAAARRRGKWAGGHPLLGYDVDPQGFKLIVNEAEAVKVRHIFALYLEHRSVRRVLVELDLLGWRTKSWLTRKGKQRGGSPFSRSSLYHLLHNVTYLGKVRYKKEVHGGEHQAIIDQATWDQVHVLLREESTAARTDAATSAPLQGLLYCGCGSAMTPVHCRNHAKKYRYYTCCQKQKRGTQACTTKSLPAPVVETFIVDQLRILGQQASPIPLEETRDTASESMSPVHVRHALRSLKDRWASLDGPDQATLLHQLLQRIDYDGQTFRFTFSPIGIHRVIRETKDHAQPHSLEMTCPNNL